METIPQETFRDVIVSSTNFQRVSSLRYTLVGYSMKRHTEVTISRAETWLEFPGRFFDNLPAVPSVKSQSGILKQSLKFIRSEETNGGKTTMENRVENEVDLVGSRDRQTGLIRDGNDIFRLMIRHEFPRVVTFRNTYTDTRDTGNNRVPVAELAAAVFSRKIRYTARITNLGNPRYLIIENSCSTSVTRNGNDRGSIIGKPSGGVLTPIVIYLKNVFSRRWEASCRFYHAKFMRIVNNWVIDTIIHCA